MLVIVLCPGAIYKSTSAVNVVVIILCPGAMYSPKIAALQLLMQVMRTGQLLSWKWSRYTLSLLIGKA